MRRLLWALAALLLAGCLELELPRGAATGGETLSGRVVGVADGDTLTLLDDSLHEHKVRLAYVDAPEKAQAYGSAAKLRLSALVYGRAVRAEVIEVDRYQRAVARIWQDGQDINLMMLREGFAWHYRQYTRTQSDAEFAQYQDAETAARAEHMGLWQGQRPQAPWDYRHNRRNKG
ncbi:thermonuclease family protein [Chitiniphilus shinanonensis]|uniref:thermonuclease family protein n=1 Tax=Chitiniphilus shinanonensis TaxID=553088 RepID=UPI0012FB5F8F|nr:thermonuclease family protein [Chitiniphilus shinanonensis]